MTAATGYYTYAVPTTASLSRLAKLMLLLVAVSGVCAPINKTLALFEKRVKNSPLKNGTSRKECRLPPKSGGVQHRVRCTTRHIFLKKKISNFCRSYSKVVVRSLADNRDFLHHVSIFYFIFWSLFGFL